MIKNSEKYPLLSTEWNYDKNKKDFDEIKRSDSNFYWWNCSECNNEIYLTMNRRFAKKKEGIRCPYCSSSKNSKILYLALQNSEITFKVEEVMSDLLGSKGSNLRFDYAIYEDDKILGLIEYDGQYHDGTLSIIEYDELKNNYCLDKNIPLLRINHKENHMIHQNLYSFLINFKIKFNEEYLKEKIKEEISESNSKILELESKRKNILRNLNSLENQIENVKKSELGENTISVNELMKKGIIDFSQLGFLVFIYYEYAKSEDRYLKLNGQLASKEEVTKHYIENNEKSVSESSIRRNFKYLEDKGLLIKETQLDNKRKIVMKLSKNILF